MLINDIGDATDRAVIVNADDLGLSPGVNRGIFEAHDCGIVTSASLMVRGPGAAEAARGAAQRPGLAVGVHLDLGEWSHRGGSWKPRYTRVDVEDRLAVSVEVESQIDAFSSLMGQLPTHLDSHQHFHRHPALGRYLSDVGSRLDIPVRDQVIPFRGDFYGQLATGEPFPFGITVSNLVRLIESLPAGVSEIGCHPGYPDGLDNDYAAERLVELRVLCAPEVRQALADADVRLVSFAEVSAGGGSRLAP